MTFQAPLLLGLLAVVPLVAVVYALTQRRAQKFAVRYTNVDLLIAVAGRSWTRHLPAAAGAAGARRAADRARAAAAHGGRRAP